MAVRVAIASGNWSNPAIWNGGVLPTVGDIVASNTFTVTINQNINVASITNTAQAVVGAVPNMTSNTAPSGIVTSSNNSSAAYDAFGGDFNTEWSGGDGAWIAYEFTTAKAIDQYNFQSYTAKYSWSFEGWNGSSWVVIHTLSGQSVPGYTSPLLGNSTPYIKYRIVFLSGLNGGGYRMHTIQFYEYLGTSAATAGGGFILNSGVTVTCTGTDGIVSGTVTCLTYAGATSANIICTGNIVTPSANSIRTINITSGTLNISALNLRGGAGGSNRYAIQVSGTGTTLNYTGLINLGGSDYGGITALTGTIVSVVGDCLAPNGSNHSAVLFSGSQLNITGLLRGGPGGGSNTHGLLATSGTINITGDIEGSINITINSGVLLNGQVIINVLGKIAGKAGAGLSTSQIIYLNHIGTIESSSTSITTSNIGLNSTNAGAIHLLSGPFISHPTGIQPLYVSRMHYRRTMGSYFEFRNNSTNGALPPAASAPATRLVSPDTVTDSPIPANVRQGTSYAAGSQTGTMIVPSPSNVANNVPIDNTVGTAVLDPNAIWAVPLTSINTLNSIGRRVKNAATVETTGAQIQTTINSNP